ncbi:MAG: signal peptidase I [Ignavibacteria bacterium]|nr:signal peptidase I [Ignavibacteria bacterium]
MDENKIVIENAVSNEQAPLKRNLFLIILFSYLCPGLGHIYAGDLKRGILVYFIYYFAYILLIVLGIVFYPAIFFLTVLLTLFVILDSVIFSRNHKIFALKWFNKWYVYILIYIVSVFLFSVLIRSNVMEGFVIPTVSMENTILPGDYLIANKSSYGLHIPYTEKYLFRYNSPKRDDIVVFNRTELNNKNATDGVKYVSRCIGLPGDTLLIKNRSIYCSGKLYRNSANVKYITPVVPEDVGEDRIFPKGYKWNKDNYGPIYIPKKGDVINITQDNYVLWKQIIEFDGHNCEKKSGGTIYVDDKIISDGNYKVENNYYFLISDNRDVSVDSRYNGFIPEDKIVGKVSTIYWSWDPNINWIMPVHKISSIRWNRIGLRIE